jgi:hypothetical protein
VEPGSASGRRKKETLDSAMGRPLKIGPLAKNKRTVDEFIFIYIYLTILIPNTQKLIHRKSG